MFFVKKILSFIIGVIIFSVIPLIVWGLDDFNGFIHHPARLIYIIMMTLATIGVVIFVPEEGRSRGEGKKLVKRQKLSLLFLQIIPLVIIILAPWSDRHGFAVFQNGIILRYIGLVLGFSGFFLMNWAVLILDKQFSVDITIQDNHNLITKGPYKYIRHPRYLGIIMFLTGITLIFHSWVALILIIPTILILLWRINDEERLMHEEFKEDWDQYKDKTSSLLPWLY